MCRMFFLFSDCASLCAKGVGRVALDTDEQFRDFMSSVDSKPEQEIVIQEESAFDCY